MKFSRKARLLLKEAQKLFKIVNYCIEKSNYYDTEIRAIKWFSEHCLSEKEKFFYDIKINSKMINLCTRSLQYISLAHQLMKKNKGLFREIQNEKRILE